MDFDGPRLLELLGSPAEVRRHYCASCSWRTAPSICTILVWRYYWGMSGPDADIVELVRMTPSDCQQLWGW